MVPAEVNAKAVKFEVGHKGFKSSGDTINYSDLELRCHSNMGVHQAINKYENALRIDADHALAHSKRGEDFCAWGEIRLAIKEWEEALKLEPRLTRPHHNLAVVYRSQGKLDLAVAEWKKVLCSDPNDADALFGLGEAYEKLGECIKAVGCYQRYVYVVLPEEHHSKIAEERIQHLCKVIKAVHSSNIGGCL